MSVGWIGHTLRSTSNRSTNRSTASLWVPKWELATPIFSWVTSKINFASNLMAPNLNFTAATTTIALALHLAEKNVIIL